MEWNSLGGEMMKYYQVISYCVLSAIIGYALSGSVTHQSTVNQTLKMCNEKPLECKFKYDILMYTETGKVPYKDQPKNQK